MLFFKYILEVSNFVENCCLFIIPDGPKNMLLCCMEVLMKALSFNILRLNESNAQRGGGALPNDKPPYPPLRQ